MPGVLRIYSPSTVSDGPTSQAFREEEFCLLFCEMLRLLDHHFCFFLYEVQHVAFDSSSPIRLFFHSSMPDERWDLLMRYRLYINYRLARWPLRRYLVLFSISSISFVFSSSIFYDIRWSFRLLDPFFITCDDYRTILVFRIVFTPRSKHVSL